MRINKFIAQNTHLSRRQADEAIASARITINSKTASIGDTIKTDDVITLDNKVISGSSENLTILLNKPIGYVCSRDGQGSPTVYDLLPKKYEYLNIAGRLDKDSCGLVILTSDGDLLYELTHPSKDKEKVYEIELNEQLSDSDIKQLTTGVDIGDERPSKFAKIEELKSKKYKVTLEEGRNRQIRRSLESIQKNILSLKRIKHADFLLDNIIEGKYTIDISY